MNLDDSERVVGNPSFTGLGKSCSSLGCNRQVSRRALISAGVCVAVDGVSRKFYAAELVSVTRIRPQFIERRLRLKGIELKIPATECRLQTFESPIDVSQLRANHGRGNRRNVFPFSHIINLPQKLFRFVSFTRKHVGPAAPTIRIMSKLRVTQFPDRFRGVPTAHVDQS